MAERLYLPLVGGLLVTLRHFLRNLFHPGRMLTIEYPEERRNYSHRFRGHHILTTRPDGSVRCVACNLCAQACPAECIHIEAGERPRTAKFWRATNELPFIAAIIMVLAVTTEFTFR